MRNLIFGLLSRSLFHYNDRQVILFRKSMTCGIFWELQVTGQRYTVEYVIGVQKVLHCIFWDRQDSLNLALQGDHREASFFLKYE
jgi:hypothetical protein